MDDSELDALDDMYSDSDDSLAAYSDRKTKNKKKGKKKNRGGYAEEAVVFKTGEWSAEEKQKLTELLQKWPAGTPKCMGRLSEELLRSENDLSKQLKALRAAQHDTAR